MSWGAEGSGGHPSNLTGGHKEDRRSPFTRSHGERMRGNGYKLYQGRFHLDVRKKGFTVRTTDLWNKLPRAVVESPSLGLFKTGRRRWIISPRLPFPRKAGPAELLRSFPIGAVLILPRRSSAS